LKPKELKTHQLTGKLQNFLIQKIRENGGDLDIEDNTNGTTALIKACAKSRTSAALQLIEAGASLDFVDVGEEDKLTALDYAILGNLEIVVNAIIRKGGHTFQELDAIKRTRYE
jgi:ankyrin repeat protein